LSEQEALSVQRIRLSPNIDPELHLEQIKKLIRTRLGDSWVLQGIEGSEAIAVSATTVQQISDQGDHKIVTLASGTSVSKGDEIAAKLLEQHSMHMVKFEPFVNRAVLSKLTYDEVRCRGAIAKALSAKPWDVQVRSRPDGGFNVTLPATYMPSKHDKALTEIAEAVVGQFGWYIKTDAKHLKLEIIPSDPPTFPSMVPYPFNKPPQFNVSTKDWAQIPLGMKLPPAGEQRGELFTMDMKAGAHCLVGGLSGAGKSVTINAIIAGWLARGAEIVIVDVPDKSVDFLWCKPFVREHGWGCDSPRHALTALALVREEGTRRADILKEHEALNYAELPAGFDLKPLVVIVDELAGLLAYDKVPPGMPKDEPIRLEIEQENMFKAQTERMINKIAAELRFVGVFLLVASQVTNANTGLGPKLRTNLHQKLLMGPKPTPSARGQILSNPDNVPEVPINVKMDGVANRGVGVAEPEGTEPCVFKTFYATTDDYRKWLLKLGVKTTLNPDPTMGQLLRHAKSADDDEPQYKSNPAHKEPTSYGADGKPLRGAAAAGHASKSLAS
jgi:hypothetical protein